MWIFFIIILFVAIMFLLFYPFKYTVYNENEYLYIKISKIITIKINLLILFDNNHNEEIKKQAKMIKLFNKIKIQLIDIKISGLNLNYEVGGELFGYLNIILACLKNYFLIKNVDFNYNVNYMGRKSLKFKGIFYVNTGTILKQILGGKKNERTSN